MGGPSANRPDCFPRLGNFAQTDFIVRETWIPFGTRNHGALVNDINDDGDTALHIASYLGHLDIVRVLLEHPAANEFDTAALRCHIHGKDGMTALHLAVLGKHADIVLLLLFHGALVDDLDEHGNIPLHFAAANGYVDILHMLLDHRNVDGSNMAVTQCSIHDKYGRTALHKAAKQGHSQICRVLLDHGALVDIADNDGYTPSRLIELTGRSPLARIQSEHRAACRSYALGTKHPGRASRVVTVGRGS